VSPRGTNWGFYIPEDGVLHSHRRENLKYFLAYLLFPCCAEGRDSDDLLADSISVKYACIAIDKG
jgi:hypothetical protein